ncbi:MAG: hypothetical protein BGO49_22950 [Planctomycetales bacterium 71-10]|nr:MAG: hypothetical protein BGO49_22950 [Planctomycetales bacterium 71-10]
MSRSRRAKRRPPREARPPRPARGGGAAAPPADRLLDLSATILENSRAVVYVKDALGRYLFVNRRFEDVLGVRARDVLGRTDHEVHDRETADRLRANDRRVMKAGAAEEVEEIVPTAGSERPRVYVSVKEPLCDREGRPYALCGISTDVTEWRRAEEALRMEKQRYRSLVEATAAIVWSTPPCGEFRSEQPGWSEFTGQTTGELMGWGWLDAIHPEDREATRRAWSEALETQGGYMVEHRIRRRDGAYRDMCARAVAILGPDGEPCEWFGVHVDVTERRAAEAASRESRRRLAAALDASGTGTFRWDFETDAMEWDDRMRALAGVPPGYRPTGADVLSLIHPDDRPAMSRALEAVRSGEDRSPEEYRVLLPGGGVRWLRVQGRVFRDAEGGPSHSIGGCVDVTDLKLAEERLSHRVNHDMLTGLPNRSLLHSAMESLVARGAEPPRFAFLLLDLDRFKEINDTFGHDHGDAVLQEMRPRLRAAVAGPGLIARLGGDEFGILLEGAGAGEAEAAAQAVLTSLQRPVFVNGQVLEVGASVGIALFPDHGRDVASLVRVADVAMYAAKRSRAGWATYRAEQDRSCPRRLNMVGELRQAIEEGQLLLHYQPKVDLRTMLDAGVEALVRWRHPRHGMLQPCDFIPIAEETGLIRPLSLWILERALRDRLAWVEAGIDLGVAVNLAPDSLQDLDLAPVVAELLARHDAPPWRLTIEVTETAMMKNPARAQAVLTAIHAMGVRISIDDFGTGYSSLAYLKELPVDEVKVDRSFVQDASASRRDACIVRSVIDLGHNLGLKVVAEGVEDEPTLERLRGWGCDLAQGWRLGRPTSADEYRLRHRPAAPPCAPASAPAPAPVTAGGGGWERAGRVLALASLAP